jgi:hypothetical protein
MLEKVVVLAIPEFGLRQHFYDMLKVEGIGKVVGVRNWKDLMKKLEDVVPDVLVVSGDLTGLPSISELNRFGAVVVLIGDKPFVTDFDGQVVYRKEEGWGSRLVGTVIKLLG